jgi:hypothetical protein
MVPVKKAVTCQFKVHLSGWTRGSINGFFNVMERGDGMSEDLCQSTRRTGSCDQVLTKRSIELNAAKSSLGRIADGILLEGPSLEGKPVGISRSVKLILTLFVSTLLAVFGAISVEYVVRATRPI